jgi:NADH-quinone oxidoreductase subunit C
MAEETPPQRPAPGPSHAGETKKAAPAKPGATDASDHLYVRSIRAALPDTVLEAKQFVGQITVTVAREQIARVARHLKEAEDFRYCVDVTAVDWRDRQPRFDVVYHFYSFSKNDRIRIKCGAAEGEEVPSIATVFLAANWPERETFDMFGIRFSGHPDLRRILTWDGFHGHPLRKDFPVEGIDTGAAVYPEEWPEGGGPPKDDPNRKVVS